MRWHNVPLSANWEFEAIGTPWRIDTQDELDRFQRETVSNRIEAFDRDWSRFRTDSLVSRIADRPGRHRMPADARPLMDWYGELYEATGGRVTPLVGRTLESLGYDATYRLTATAARVAVPAWADAMAWDGEYLDTVLPVLLDIGAAGKGYLVDLIGDLLVELGFDSNVVDASGDMRTRGGNVERVALEHPADPSKAIGVVELCGGALCASATNRRSWGDGLHHVIDAVTGLPTTNVVATWVMAPDALHADGLATALFFEPAPNLFAKDDVYYVRMFANGRVEHSPSFPGELFT